MDSQHAQTIINQEICAGSSDTMYCEEDFTLIPINAFYGVSQAPDSCIYRAGDCITDAFTTISCTLNSLRCTVMAWKKILPQCNNQNSSYLHIKYQCIPTKMHDPSQEYTLCQSDAEITSDYGIIKSPGYPEQFQPTNTDCHRTIRAPKEKRIRLWLTNLFIGPLLGNTCDQDRLLVVDGTQKFQHCGRKHFAYPILCSSAIIVQYMTNTASSTFRGMQMYFETVNQSTFDNCSNVSVTPELTGITTTTNRPVSSASTSKTTPASSTNMSSSSHMYDTWSIFICGPHSLNLLLQYFLFY